MPQTYGHFYTGVKSKLGQTRRGCRGHIPSNILVGGRQWEYRHPKYYYVPVLSDIADSSSPK